MRKTFLILVGAMLLLTGCDFFRVIAGRPTSKDIENKRTEIRLAEEALEQARLDSIARVEMEAAKAAKAAKDSVDALALIAEKKITVYTVAGLRGVSEDGLPAGSEYRYRVVVGSFREKANAEAMKTKISQPGDCKAHLITFNNGMVAVGACPANKIQDAVSGLAELKKNPACPADAWILKFE